MTEQTAAAVIATTVVLLGAVLITYCLVMHHGIHC